MMKSRTAWLVLGIMVLGFFIRVIWQYHGVFTPLGVAPVDVDSAYHMRLAEWMAANFPHFLTFDTFGSFPNGQHVDYGPAVSWVMVFPAWLITLGHPTASLVASIGVWYPPVLGAVCAIPMYFLGRELFNNRFVGAMGAALLMFLPSEFMNRSLLGFTDHHVLEVLFTLCALLFLTLGLKQQKPAWGMLAGLSLGLLNWSWMGAIFLTAIILGWYYVRMVREASRGIHDTPLKEEWQVFFQTFFVSAIVTSPYIASSAQPLILQAGTGGAVVVVLLSQFLYRIPHRAVMYVGIGLPLLLVGLGLAFSPAVQRAASYLVFFTIWPGANNVVGELTSATPFGFVMNYGAAGMIALFGGILAWKWKAGNTLILTWSLILFVMSILEVRWGYYAVIGIALYSAYTGVCLHRFLEPKFQMYTTVIISITLLGVAIGGIRPMAASASQLTPDLQRAMVWMRDNTPTPTPQHWADDYTSASPAKPDYGVLCWWDNGNWVMQVAHRVPVSTPQVQEPELQTWFMADSERTANNLLAGTNVRYIVIDKHFFEKVYTPAMAHLAALYPMPVQPDVNHSFSLALYNSTSGIGQYHEVYRSGDVKVYEVAE